MHLSDLFLDVDRHPHTRAVEDMIMRLGTYLKNSNHLQGS